MTINFQKFLAKESKSSPLPGKDNPKISFNSPSVGDASKISEYSGQKLSAESVQNLSVVSAKLVDVDNFLKDSLVLDKVKAGIVKKKKEKDIRNKKENKSETPDEDTDPKTGKKKFSLPGKGFFGRVKNWIVKLLFSWLTLKLFDLLPRATNLLSKIGKALDFVMEWGGRIVGALATVVHWGYEAYDFTRNKVENVFGEKGAKIFDDVMGALKIVTGLVIAAATGAAVMTATIAAANYKKMLAMAVATKGTAGAGAVAGGGGILKWLGFGKGAGAATGATQLTIPGLTAGGGTGGALGGIGVGGLAAIILGVFGLASAIGEGGGQLTEKGKEWNKGLEQNARKHEDKKWWDPRKWGSWALWRLGGVANRLFGGFFGLLDVIGTPFRLIIEAIRWPFMSEEQRDKAALNLEKFDARIREQFRRFFNSIDFLNLVSDKSGAWGAFDWHSEKSGIDAMGYEGKEGDKSRKESKPLESEEVNVSPRSGLESLFQSTNTTSNKTNAVSHSASYDDPNQNVHTIIIPLDSPGQTIPVGEGSAPNFNKSDGGSGSSVLDPLYVR